MTPGEIYSEYFTTFHKTEQIEEIARNDNDFLFATRVYEAGDFERASVLFGMLADSSQVRAWALFYEGCSYMALNQPEKAAGIFQTVLDEGDGEVLSDAKWQLALCYIRLSRPEKATDLLMSLREDPAYRKDAGKILRILR
jgi:lipopolysaccharide biosynthesis regulator YciM